MNPKFRIILVENHSIIREGLCSLLSKEKDFEIVGEAKNGREALGLVQKTKPDLVVTDLSMPQMDGMDVIATLKKQNPKIKIAALTVHREEAYVLATLKAGADGYILKDDTYSELVLGLRSILKGNSYLSPAIAGDLVEGYVQGRRANERDIPWEILSAREREVLKQIAEGLTNKQIADRLCIGLKTVETHRHKIMKKLNVHNVSALIMVATEKGLIHQ